MKAKHYLNIAVLFACSTLAVSWGSAQQSVGEDGQASQTQQSAGASQSPRTQRQIIEGIEALREEVERLRDQVPEGTPISIEIHATPRGEVFSLKDGEGMALAVRISEDEFRNSFPELYETLAMNEVIVEPTLLGDYNCPKSGCVHHPSLDGTKSANVLRGTPSGPV